MVLGNSGVVRAAFRINGAVIYLCVLSVAVLRLFVLGPLYILKIIEIPKELHQCRGVIILAVLC